MQQDDWTARWQSNQIGFHEGSTNAQLSEHADRLGKLKRILVPLAGKAADLQWLADRGHDVVGVEFVPQAIKDFFRERGKDATPHRLGAHDAFYADGVTLVQSDIFAVTPASLGQYDHIYDRAALVALDPDKQAAYADLCRSMLRPGGGILLLALSYDQAQMQGPPWSVPEARVRALYAGMHIEVLSARQVTNPRVEQMTETAYWLSSQT